MLIYELFILESIHTPHPFIISNVWSLVRSLTSFIAKKQKGAVAMASKNYKGGLRQI